MKKVIVDLEKDAVMREARDRDRHALARLQQELAGVDEKIKATLVTGALAKSMLDRSQDKNDVLSTRYADEEDAFDRKYFAWLEAGAVGDEPIHQPGIPDGEIAAARVATRALAAAVEANGRELCELREHRARLVAEGQAVAEQVRDCWLAAIRQQFDEHIEAARQLAEYLEPVHVLNRKVSELAESRTRNKSHADQALEMFALSQQGSIDTPVRELQGEAPLSARKRELRAGLVDVIWSPTAA